MNQLGQCKYLFGNGLHTAVDFHALEPDGEVCAGGHGGEQVTPRELTAVLLQTGWPDCAVCISSIGRLVVRIQKVTSVQASSSRITAVCGLLVSPTFGLGEMQL